ncbi:MAG: B12-binding domain-containing protein [Spirochaetota bacterium]
MHNKTTDKITDAIVQGNLYDISGIIRKILETGTSPSENLEAMLAGLEICGQRFERGEYFLPELMMAGAAFKAGLKVLEPLMKSVPRSYGGTVVLGTVNGDVHDIGKNLVGFMLESAGFKRNKRRLTLCRCFQFVLFFCLKENLRRACPTSLRRRKSLPVKSE